MWILTCDGPTALGGKPRWLRPGTSHLFGRTTGRGDPGQVVEYIEHKGVSRKHLVIKVDNVKAGDSAHIHARPRITVEDLSKMGTFVNGEKIVKTKKALDQTEYKFRLGSCEDEFHLKWTPVTLSFTNIPKSSKSRGDSIATYREELEDMGVKLITDYVINKTTHVIAKKRNTASGLQGLVQGRWLLTYDFVKVLSAVVKRPGTVDAHGAPDVSLLEADFGNWPNEEDYLVPAATEPNPRPNEFLKPNPERSEIFSEFSFVFLSQSQYDNLLGPITAGGGKAFVWEVTEGESKVEELVEYVKEIAGEKSNSNFRLSQQQGLGGVVVVRLLEREDVWTKHFLREIDIALDQRSVEQSEFLDIILTLNTGELRKPLGQPANTQSSVVNADNSQSRASTARTETPTPAPRRPQDTQQDPDPPESPEEPTAPVTSKMPRRIITQSRFKGFEDFNPSQFTRPASDSPEPEPSTNREASVAPSVQNMDVDEPSQPAASQVQPTRKRPTRDEEVEDEHAMMDGILSGAAALKKRRLMSGKAGESSSTTKGAVAAEPTTTKAAIEAKSKGKKKEKEVDILAEIQARRDKEDEERRKDEESLRNAMEGIDIAELKNLAQIEEFEIPTREPPSRRSDSQRGTRVPTNSAWNGRKNFKKFRPQGTRSDVPRLQRVIVTLEEVPRKGQGLGDEYWLQSTAGSSGKSKSKSQSQRQSQSQTQTLRDDDEEEDPASFRRRVQRSREIDAEREQEDMILPSEVAGNARDPDLRAALRETQTQLSQTLGTTNQRAAAGKRPAAQQAGPTQTKKARPTRREVDLDDDDDELNFRRRRK